MFNNSRTQAAFLAAAYTAVLLVNYAYIVAPVFSYRGYVYDPQPLDIVIAFALALLPVLWFPLESTRPSVFVYYFLYILVYVPVAIMPACTLGREVDAFIPYHTCFVICFWLVSLSYRAPLANLPRLPLSSGWFWGGVVAWSMVTLLLVGQTFGFRFRMVSIFDVYDVRAAYKDEMGEAGALLNYLVGWQAKVLTPLVFCYGLRTKRTALVLGAGWFQLLLFCFSGMKTLLFSLALLLGLYFGLKISRGYLLRTLLSGILSVVVACTCIDLAMNNYSFSTLFIRRMICTPGLLTVLYYDYFSVRPKMMYGYGMLENWVDTPYTESPAGLIAGEYFGVEGGSANANLWADAYANMGFGGMIAASIALGLIFWCYDSASQRKDRVTALLILTLPSMALANTALQTTIASHGLGLAVILAFLLPDVNQTTAPATQRSSPTRRAREAAITC